MSKKDKIYIIFIILLTFIPLFLLPYPGYTKTPTADHIPVNAKYLLIFTLFNIVTIGFPAWINTVYIKDFTKIKNIFFFTIFGTILGVIFGEGGNLVMLIPYGIITAIYAYSYKHFNWWKVAITTFFVGILVENIMNRAPLQTPTIMWIAFMIYPYFWTKIIENFKGIPFKKIIKDLKGFFIWTMVLEVILFVISRGSFNIPLAIIPIVIIMTFHILISFVKALGRYKKGEIEFKVNSVADSNKDLIPLGVVLIIIISFVVIISILTKH